MFEAQQKYFSVLGSELFNVFLVKVNSWYDQTIENFEKAGDRFVKKSITFLDFDYLLTNFFDMTSIVLTIILPIILLQKGENMSNIFIIVTLVKMFLADFRTVFDILTNLNTKEVSISRLSNLLSFELDDYGDQYTNRIESYEVENIGFQYKNSNEPVLEHISGSLKKNGITLLMGENGSGKSTLIKLVTGILVPTQGVVKINGIDLCECNMEKIRKKRISFCEQEPYLVQGTVLENLNYGLAEKKSEEYFKKMPLLDFVNDLQDGYDTKISFDSGNISGGQKQRIALCRTFAKESADVLIFDEPSSALDAKGIMELSEILAAKKQDKTILLVTHENYFEQISDVTYQL